MRSFAEIVAAKETAPSLVEAISLCIQMIIDSVKEMITTGQSMKDTDCRLLAQTCIDAFSDKNHRHNPPRDPMTPAAAPVLEASQGRNIR